MHETPTTENLDPAYWSKYHKSASVVDQWTRELDHSCPLCHSISASQPVKVNANVCFMTAMFV